MELLENLKEKLKQNLSESEYSLWIEPIEFKNFENNTLTLSFPNETFVKKFNKSYKNLLETYAKEILKTEITFSIIITPSLELESEPIQIPKIKHKKTFQEIKREKTTFEDSPNFKSQAELDIVIDESKVKEKQKKKEKKALSKIKQKNLLPMPGKYGISKVASFTSFDSRFFTYPTDKRKSSKVNIKIKFDNGTSKEYELYRGLFYKGGKGKGQLNTTHAKILLAIIHIWQKQNSRFANSDSFFAMVNLSMRELAKTLGYKKFGGTEFNFLLDRVIELTEIPNLLVSGDKTFSIQFLSNLGVSSVTTTNKTQKTTISLLFNPFISKQLYERKAFLRNPEVYKIKNPIAFKFLICYDKKIFKGNSLKLSIKELSEDLQLESERTDSVVRTFKRAIKELNNYELSEKYILKVELIKENKKYFVIAERVNKKKRYNETSEKNKIIPKHLQGELSL